MNWVKSSKRRGAENPLCKYIFLWQAHIKHCAWVWWGFFNFFGGFQSCLSSLFQFKFRLLQCQCLNLAVGYIHVKLIFTESYSGYQYYTTGMSGTYVIKRNAYLRASCLVNILTMSNSSQGQVR